MVLLREFHSCSEGQQLWCGWQRHDEELVLPYASGIKGNAQINDFMMQIQSGDVLCKEKADLNCPRESHFHERDADVLFITSINTQNRAYNISFLPRHDTLHCQIRYMAMSVVFACLTLCLGQHIGPGAVFS